MDDELELCIKDLFSTLREVSEKANFANTNTLLNIQIFKEEQKETLCIRELSESILPKEDVKFGYAEMLDNGDLVVELPSGVLITVGPRSASYEIVFCFFLKAIMPNMPIKDLKEQTKYTCISSVRKAIKTVAEWGLSINIPKRIKILK